ncbi:hypothetical protein HX045_08080 [Myroides odoratimimus]|uniref:hypothetical protein n=1 Tax=Myroides odoratimimus TaxID=76832 RepID=UPI002576D719|nr:hypothetical protein [Myroides odoratimimus]MDM1466717.1 hypothetical protein [Myroides odoratimimus]MDM1470218.1 hypothetical protein [Myroides odoratimimus]MDM1479879.1 hypothetical protein [Myroides odoratimimus]MDM1483645.1 hypothetical protein [Myroides odoratimimus]MDM1496409.1 hypothetical protein [Myroides odoratimimus]
MKKLILSCLVCISTLFTSCNTSSNHYWLDNPTNEPITVYIDHTAYEIPAMTKLDIDLEYGKHQLKYNGQELIILNAGKVNKGKVIINPTQSTYVFMAHKFINENDERATDEYIKWAMKQHNDSLRLKINDTITTIFVPFKVTNKLFIDNSEYNWQYNIEEPMPEGITLSPPIITSRNRSLQNDPNYQAGQFQETLFKIYREQEFKDYLKTSSDDKIEFLIEKTPYAELPKFKLELTKINNIKDPEYKIALDQQIREFYEWLDMKGSKSTSGSKALSRSYYEFKKKKSEYLNKYPKDFSFNEAVNEYEDQINEITYKDLTILDESLK